MWLFTLKALEFHQHAAILSQFLTLTQELAKLSSQVDSTCSGDIMVYMTLNLKDRKVQRIYDTDE